MHVHARIAGGQQEHSEREEEQPRYRYDVAHLDQLGCADSQGTWSKIAKELEEDDA